MRMRLFPVAALVCLMLQARISGQERHQQAVNADKPASPPFALAAAQRLEQLKAWDKAADEYLKVDSGASAADRQAALEGLARVHEKAEAEKRETALSAAEDLEQSRHWKEAEQVYIDVIKSDPSAQKAAAERLERVSPHLTNRRWPEWIDEAALDTGRGLLVLFFIAGVLLFARATLKTRNTVQFLPFRGSTKDTAKQIGFWLERVLSDLRSPARTFPLAPSLDSSLPFIGLPSLTPQVPDFDLEVGGTKIPFQAIYEILGKPKARVSGTWYAGASGSALATIQKRHGFDEYVPFSSATRPISGSAGAAQDRDLQLFAYAVFIEAAKI